MPKGRPLVERVIVVCFACGKEIVKRKSDADRNISQRFFCSNKCLWKVGAKPRTLKDRDCEWCGKRFHPQTVKAPSRFCSISCFNDWQGRNGVMRECEICGDEFRLPPSRAKLEAARFCSKKCEGISRIKRPLERIHNDRQAKLDDDGYVWVYEPSHPKANRDGWMAEHRLVAEKALGRALTPDDHVHHINRVKDDNRPENLQVMGHLEHASITGLDIQQRLREWEKYRRLHGPLDDETPMA